MRCRLSLASRCTRWHYACPISSLSCVPFCYSSLYMRTSGVIVHHVVDPESSGSVLYNCYCAGLLLEMESCKQNNENMWPTAYLETTIMLKTIAAKPVRNYTDPSLAGNSGSKPLQEVIETDKLVLQSHVLGYTRVSNSNPLFPVFRNSIRARANCLMLCEHGPTAKVKTSEYVQLSPYHSHVAINQSIPGYLLRMLKPIEPLGFITCILRFPHFAH